MGIYFLLLIHLSLMYQIFILYFLGFFLHIRVRGCSTYSVLLFEDSFSTSWIRPLFCLLWFYPLFQGRFVYPAYRRFVSIVLVWIRPLLPIKLGFMPAYSVILCEDSVHLQHYGFVHCLVCCGFIHCFRPDSSTLLTGDSSSLF